MWQHNLNLAFRGFLAGLHIGNLVSRQSSATWVQHILWVCPVSGSSALPQGTGCMLGINLFPRTDLLTLATCDLDVTRSRAKIARGSQMSDFTVAIY
jgi:hypothetical protein